ncbi:Wnt and FGF inhibitory regulator [Microdochium nivale]|nr:Wnt and FGF inhibitory regulator [Microdochium nivale]
MAITMSSLATPTTTTPIPSSTGLSLIDAAKPSNATGFVGSSAFYFVVVGIPVILFVIACVLAGCCCCCTGLGYKAIRQRRRQRRHDAFSGHSAKIEPTEHNAPQTPTSLFDKPNIPSCTELQAPPATYMQHPRGNVPELHGSPDEPPPGYHVANGQQGVVDESGFKYDVGADKRV